MPGWLASGPLDGDPGLVETPDTDRMDDDEFERELDRNNLRPDGGSWGWTPGRVIGILLVLGMAGFWLWAFLWSPRGHPDELDDPAFTVAAEARCAVAVEEVRAVPSADQATDLDDRADQLVITTGILDEMVSDLRAQAPSPTIRDGELVDAWLDDWDTYIADRFIYIERLRAGEDTIFEVTARDGDQITAPLDLFATINRMPSCQAPGDV